MSTPWVSDNIERAVLRVSQRLQTMKPPSTWEKRSEAALWFELIACMLGSRVQFEHSQAAACYLQEKGLLDIAVCLSNEKKFETEIAEALSQPIYPPLTRSGQGRKYIYPKLRAAHITRTVRTLYKSGGSIRGILHSCREPREARTGIMSATTGVGPKQSSLFLRNIGYTDTLAILDTHVLRYMCTLGIAQTSSHQVAKLHEYETMEDRLRSYSKRLSVNLSDLDTAIWVVMRVCAQGVV